MEPVQQRPDDEALAAQQGFLLRAARQLVGDEQAEDLVQDTWVAALERPPARGAALRAWLATVLRRRRATALEAGARRRARERAAARTEAVPGPDEVQERLELVVRVAAAMRALPEPYAQVLYARVYEDRPPRAIAAELDVPLETVYSRLRRGKELLRERLDGEYGDRASWALLLLPLVGPTVPAPAPAEPVGPLASASTATWSLLVGTKTLTVAALVLVTSLAVWLGGRGVDSPEPTGSVAERAEAGPQPSGDPPLTAAPASVVSAERVPVETAPAAPDGTRAALRFRVTFADGAPAAGAFGQIAPGREYSVDPERVRTFQLDAAGAEQLEDLDPGDWRVTLYGRAGWDVVLPAAEWTEHAFVLPVGLTVEGRVLDPAGEPAADALVHVVPDRSVAIGGFPLVRTDAAGSFRLRDLAPWRPSGPWTELTASKDGYTSAEAFTVGGDVGQERAVILRLHGLAGPLAGRVVDEEGTPVAGALLTFTPHDNRSNGFTNAEGVALSPGAPLELRTAADGTFRTERARLGEQPVKIEHDDHPEASRLVEVTRELGPPVELVLSNGGRLAGSLVGADGAPVPDHLIRMKPERERRYRYTRTDASGDFTARGLPAGRVSVWWMPGSGDRPELEATIEHGRTTTVALELQPKRPASGTLTAEDGTPLALHRVCICRPDAPGVWIRDARADAAGRFTFDDVPEGDKRIEVRAPRAFEHPPLLSIAWPGADALDLVVPDAQRPSARLAFRVVDQAGTPRAGAEWWLSHATENWSQQGFSDAEGRAEHGPLVPGRYTLRVEAPELVERELAAFDVRPDEALDLGDVSLTRGGRLEVELSSSDPAVAVVHARARLVPLDGGETVHLQAADDRIESPLLTPGDYTLHVASHTVAALERAVHIDAGETTALALTVDPGTYRAFRFEPPAPEGGELQVEVFAPDGRRHPTQALVLSDQATVPGLSLGAWRLVVEGTDGLRAEHAFRVESLDAPTTTIDVERR